MYAVEMETGTIRISPEPSGLEGEIEFDSLPEGEGPLYIEDGVLKRRPYDQKEMEEVATVSVEDLIDALLY